MKIDASKSAAENLLALVNATNASANLTAAQVSFGAPSVKTDTGDGRNTSLVITGNGTDYQGTVTVNYVRRPLNDSVLTPDFTFDVTDGVTKQQIIDGVATKLGLVAADLDLTGDITRPAGGVLTSEVTLTVGAAGSSLYLPDATQTITLNWQNTAPQLDSVVTDPNMTGFDAAS